MMIKTPTSLYRLREVYSLEITKSINKKVTKPWVWYKPLIPPVVEEIPIYELNMIYLSEYETREKARWTCPQEKTIRDLYENVVEQIKTQDHEIMDRAFEDAVANLGKK